MIWRAIGVAYLYLFLLLIKPDEKLNEEVDISYLTREHDKIRQVLRALKSKGNSTNITYFKPYYKRPTRFPSDLKFILKYTTAFSYYNAPIFRDGQLPFISNNCSYLNCFITNEKTYLGYLQHFDAILFDVENDWDIHPYFRERHQRYVFLATESAQEFPICDTKFNNYYNLTWTYRLDSDIRWSFITITDKNGAVVGPKINMNWIEDTKPVPKDVIEKIVYKKIAAAWFVSHCNAKSGRDEVAAKIKKALEKYNLTVDIYGWCGTKTCPRDEITECLDMLERNYYFYFAFENALDADYVTEKLLYAVMHYTVPVVFGGANYSRFLPPNSYIDAAENADSVAKKMAKAINDPETYYGYFKWHNHYQYEQSPEDPDICNLCRILNESGDKETTVRDMRKWWQPQYSTLCHDPS